MPTPEELGSRDGSPEPVAGSDRERDGAATPDPLAAAAHDLRTPIAVIKGLAALTRSQWARLPQVTKLESLEIIERQAEQLSRLVDEVVLGSRVVVHPAASEPEAVPLRENVATVLQELGVEREFDVHVPVALCVVAEREHLAGIIRAYVENARSHGAAPFTIDAHERGGDVVIRVVDCGDGVRGELVHRLFGGSDDVGETEAAGSSSTGAGLSVARRLARGCGGDAWYEPISPRGACFAVTLPGGRST